MMTYLFETSFAFPLIKLSTIITYSKVKKPSGISYFILVLINEWHNKTSRFDELLTQFGVPKDMFSLFGREVMELMTNGILESPLPMYPELFPKCQINDFSFTSKGKKVFMEELIPLDMNEQLRQEIFYNPALNQLAITVDSKYGSIVGSVLTEEFMRQFTVPSTDEIEDYFNSKKSNGIAIKREEVITKVELVDQHYHYFTNSIQLHILDHHRLDITLETDTLTNFLKKYYTAQQIQMGLLKKDKFDFGDLVVEQISLSEETDVYRLAYPEEWKKVAASSALVDITLSQVASSGNKMRYNEPALLQRFHSQAKLIKIINPTKAFLYVPVRVKLQYLNDQHIELPFLLERPLNSNEINLVVRELVVSSRESSIENKATFKKLVDLCKGMKQEQLLKEFIRQSLANSGENIISVVAVMREVLENEPAIYFFLKNESIPFIDQYLADSTITTITHKLEAIRWIYKGIHSDIDLLKKLIDLPNIKPLTSDVRLFDVFEKLSFDYKDIVLVMPGILSIVSKDLSSKSELGVKMHRLQYTLEQLVKLSGIKDPLEYQAYELIDMDQFIQRFSAFNEAYQTLSSVLSLDKQGFYTMTQLHAIHRDMDKLFKLEKSAMNNPKSITKDLVYARLKNGDILTATVNLYIKLTYVCKTVFHYEGDISQMIDRLLRENHINKQESGLLHQFRQYRNDVEHANQNGKKMSTNEFYDLTELVFTLEEVKL